MVCFQFVDAADPLTVNARWPWTPQHPPCAEHLESYQADYVASSYNISKHMGFFYELAFRDLYPASPECDCQHTTKKLPEGGTNYEEQFNFQCGPSPEKQMPIENIITMNHTAGAATAVYNQTIVHTMGMGIPKFLDTPFHTTTIAFNDTGADQYEWVIEFTCGGIPLFFPGGFVGINLYSRTISDTNLQAMLAAVKRLNLSWALDDWGWGFHTVPHANYCKYNSSTERREQVEAPQLIV
jgi:hypothetical protein